MTGTGNGCAAYHKSMEMLILLFLLYLSQKETPVKESMDSFLKFYRENRELISMLTSVLPKEEGNRDEKQEERAQKKSARTEPSLSALEAFLNRNSV